MASLVYPKWKLTQMNGSAVNFAADPIYAMLVTDTYVNTALATLKTHQFRSDVTAIGGAEVTGTGYTAGGVQLAGVAVALSGDNVVFSATNPSWAASTITARGLVLFKRVGADLSTPADDPIIALYDFGADVSSTAGTFTVSGMSTTPLELV